MSFVMGLLGRYVVYMVVVFVVGGVMGYLFNGKKGVIDVADVFLIVKNVVL